MTAPDRDPGLDTLLDLHEQTLFVDDIGQWVKFVVLRTEVTPDRRTGSTIRSRFTRPMARGWSGSTMPTR